MKKKDILRVPGWLDGVSNGGQEVILSSSIRLLRNVKDVPMSHVASREQLRGIKKKLTPMWARLKKEEGFQEWDADSLPLIDLGVLYEKHCMPFIGDQDIHSLFVLTNEAFDTRILLNYQEHINIHSFAIGLDFDSLYQRARALESEMEDAVEFAFNKRYGYLMSDIKSSGAAIQASVVLHLPALMGTEKISKIESNLDKMDLCLERLYRDEQKNALGNLFVLNNKPNMGDDDSTICEKVRSVALNLEKREKQMRRVLYIKSPVFVENYVWRAVGLLKTARMITAAEMLSMLSYIGLGIDLGILDNIGWRSVKKLIVQARNSHLQALYPGKDLEQVRASIVRDVFKEV